MGVVDHHRSLIPVGDVANAGQRRDVAVHRKDAVGDDEDRSIRAARAARSAGIAQHLLQAIDVAMREDGACRLRQPNAVDDRGVIELVADDQVGVGRDRRNCSAVGGQARLQRQHCFDMLEIGQALLELLDQLGRAGDRAHGAGAHTELADGLLGRGDEMRMGSQAEVVVRREADDRPPVDRRVHRLGAGHDAQWPIEVLGAQLVGLLTEIGERIGAGDRLRGSHAHASWGSRTILPACPDATRSNACSYSESGSRWLMIGAMSRPSSSRAVVRYHVSQSRRPVMP